SECAIASQAIHKSPIDGDALHASMKALSLQARSTAALSRYTKELNPLLESLVVNYARQTLRKLSGNCGQLDLDTVATLRQTAPEASLLLDFLQEQLVQDGTLSISSTAWSLISSQEDTSPVDLWKTLLRDYPEYA